MRPTAECQLNAILDLRLVTYLIVVPRKEVYKCVDVFIDGRSRIDTDL
jgi:hypothetical protein